VEFFTSADLMRTGVQTPDEKQRRQEGKSIMASTRAYLSSNIRNDNKFVVKPGLLVFHFGDIPLSLEDGQLYCGLGNIGNTPPENLLAHVTHFTYLNQHLYCPRADRECGIYGDKDEYAELTSRWDESETQWINTLFIRAKTLEKLRELYLRVLGGQARPDIPFDQPQTGMTVAEMRAKIERQEALINGLGEDLSAKLRELQHLRPKYDMAVNRYRSFTESVQAMQRTYSRWRRLAVFWPVWLTARKLRGLVDLSGYDLKA
jgi:hypothetical protein